MCLTTPYLKTNLPTWTQVHLVFKQCGHWMGKWQQCRSETSNDTCVWLTAPSAQHIVLYRFALDSEYGKYEFLQLCDVIITSNLILKNILIQSPGYTGGTLRWNAALVLARSVCFNLWSEQEYCIPGAHNDGQSVAHCMYAWWKSFTVALYKSTITGVHSSLES